MTAEIEWAEPPASDASGVEQIAAALRANPGRWARIKSDTTDNSLGSRIRYGMSKAWRPAGDFDARLVTVSNDGEKRRYDVYARYVGAGESA